MHHNRLILELNVRIARSLPYRGRVVALGCGTCPYKDWILSVADEYVGVDWGNSFHDSSCVDIVADLTKRLPIEDGFADTVVSFQVMEHLPEPLDFLKECHRILRGGGQLFITVPFMWHVHEAPYDYFRYTRHGLTYLLQKSGFTDIDVRENTGFWQMWILKFNYYVAAATPARLHLLWRPVWWLGQRVAPWLDRVGPTPQETASYTVVAARPDTVPDAIPR